MAVVDGSVESATAIVVVAPSSGSVDPEESDVELHPLTNSATATDKDQRRLRMDHDLRMCELTTSL
ncbi:MAG: hypothetical protein Q7V57_06470 [Actinomycetota bacterium]|nr:hypothetical protein [Actinomycetota bacterium]